MLVRFENNTQKIHQKGYEMLSTPSIQRPQKNARSNIRLAYHYLFYYSIAVPVCKAAHAIPCFLP